MAVSGGDLLIDLLRSCGIEYIFCSPGSEWTPVWEGLLKCREDGEAAPQYLNCRDEILAVSMAQGYAESTGGLPAVLLHAGAGSLHGAMAMRNAYSARVPLLIFGGESCEHRGDGEVGPQGWHWLGLLSDLESPADLVKDYVKWSRAVSTADNLADAVYRGSQIARAAPAGPVFISVTQELMQKSPPDIRISPPPRVVRTAPRLDDVRQAAQWLLQAKSPAIIVERAGGKPGVVKSLTELAEALGAPVFEGSVPFSSNFPRNHPLNLGLSTAEALEEMDAVFIVSGTVPWYPASAGPASDARVIVLDEAPRHENLPYWGYRVDLSLAADVEEGLAALADIVKGEMSKQKGPPTLYQKRAELWRGRHEGMVKLWEDEALAGKGDKPIAAPWFLHTARQVFPDGAIILDETIVHARTVHRYLAEPGHYIKSAYGGLGVGIGETLGVKLANADRPVILIIGDGSFNYNPALAGLGFCQEYRMPIFIIILNNGGYMAMKYGYHRLHPGSTSSPRSTRRNYLGVDITPPPDYTKIAGAFGVYGEKLEEPGDIEAALKRGLAQIAKGRAALLDAVVA
ncbi:MAG: thiamine pyrophosphate-dependent enzyme [Chloroflexota bacterium]